MMKLTALIGDPHTRVAVESLRPTFHNLPLSLYVFADGVFITAARNTQTDLIACEVLRFGDLPIRAALQRASETTSFDNEAGLKDGAPRLLVLAEVAQCIGLIPLTAKATMLVRGGQGRERIVEVTRLQSREKLAALATDPSKLPISRLSRDPLNWYELLPASKALYFRYEICANEPGHPVSELTKAMLAAIDTNKIERVIVDLRTKTGVAGPRFGH